MISGHIRSQTASFFYQQYYCCTFAVKRPCFLACTSQISDYQRECNLIRTHHSFVCSYISAVQGGELLLILAGAPPPRVPRSSGLPRCPHHLVVLTQCWGHYVSEWSESWGSSSSYPWQSLSSAPGSVNKSILFGYLFILYKRQLPTNQYGGGHGWLKVLLLAKFVWPISQIWLLCPTSEFD